LKIKKYNLFKAESYTKGTISSILFNTIAKFVQFLNIIFIGVIFGANTETDLYYFLYNFIILVIASFISSIDILVLLPEFIKIRDTLNVRKAISFINKFLYMYLLGGFFLFALCFFFSVSIYSIISNFSLEILENNKAELILGFLIIPLIISCNLLTSVLVSYKYFTIPNIVTLINNGLCLIFLLTFNKKFGITSAILGTVIGYIINLIILANILVIKLDWNFMWVTKDFDKRIFKFIGATQITACVVALRIYFTQFLLSGFGGGILTAINWGNQIGSIVDMLINSQLYTVSGIKFSQFYVNNEKENAIKFLHNVFSILFSLGCIIFIVIFFNRFEIVNLINAKNKFTQEVLIVLGLSLVFLTLSPTINIITALSNKILSAFQFINLIVLRNSIIGQILSILLLYIGVKGWGYYGYFFATVLGFIIIGFLNYKLINRYFETFTLLSLFKHNIKTIILSILAFITLMLLKKASILSEKFSPFVNILIVVFFVFTIFFRKLKTDFINLKHSIQ
jgi:putative peptidoglycan lipid II flippase